MNLNPKIQDLKILVINKLPYKQRLNPKREARSAKGQTFSLL
jgi:hypothetical protein